jgi:hypothetical protein
MALQAFVDQLAPISVFSTSYDLNAQQRGQIVSVPLLGNVSATSAENSYEVADTAGVTGVNLSLSTYRKATISIKDSVWWNSSAISVEKFANQLSASVATAIQGLMFANITASNFGAAAVTGSPASFGLAGVRKARLALVANKAPRDGRTLVLNAPAYDSVLADISNAAAFGSTDGIAKGQPLEIYGMKIIEAPSLPTNSENLFGYACVPTAMAIAVRALVPQDSTMYLDSRVVTDAQSGISLSYRRHYAPSTGTMHVTTEGLFGQAVGITAGLVRLAGS